MHNSSRLGAYFTMGLVMGFLCGALYLAADKANRINDSFKKSDIDEAASKEACSKPQESCLPRNRK